MKRGEQRHEQGHPLRPLERAQRLHERLGISRLSTEPPKVCTAGRGRSPGSSSTGKGAVKRARQYAAWGRIGRPRQPLALTAHDVGVPDGRRGRVPGAGREAL